MSSGTHQDVLEYECVIVRGGPARLSAAVYMGRFERRTLLIDSGEGRWVYGQHNENYLGGAASSKAQAIHDMRTVAPCLTFTSR